MSCKRTIYKNCSCNICRRRKSIHVKALLDRHRAPTRQKAVERRSKGLIPTYETLETWFNYET